MLKHKILEEANIWKIVIDNHRKHGVKFFLGSLSTFASLIVIRSIELKK